MFDQMVDNTKIYLSEEELKLVSDKEWILTKGKITNGVFALFGSLSEAMKIIHDSKKKAFLVEIPASSPKIFKGENYLNLPYVLLDYPRFFGKEDIFAVRTMFWWGNFFSMTLHVGGIYKLAFQHDILNNIIRQPEDFYICIHENQWHHYFEEDNYIPVSSMESDELRSIISRRPFLKVSMKFPLNKWNVMNEELIKAFEKLLNLPLS